MLVTFRSTATETITMFEDVSRALLTLMCARSTKCTPKPLTVSARLVSCPFTSSAALPAPSTSAVTLLDTSANSAVPASFTSPNVSSTLSTMKRMNRFQPAPELAILDREVAGLYDLAKALGARIPLARILAPHLSPPTRRAVAG